MRRLFLLAAAALVAGEAMAEGRFAVPQNDRWKAECGSCHVAYPPRLLPAQSWRRLIAGLDRHFGTDASVEPAVAAEIASFLEQHAGRRPSDSLRITETGWFQREHRKVSAKDPASCESCHTTAAEGDFRERNIRLPR